MLSMNYESGSESEAEVYQGYVTLQSVKKGFKISANVHSLRDGSVALATSTASTICIFGLMLAAPSRSCMSPKPHLSNTACQVGCSYQLWQLCLSHHQAWSFSQSSWNKTVGLHNCTWTDAACFNLRPWFAKNAMQIIQLDAYGVGLIDQHPQTSFWAHILRIWQAIAFVSYHFLYHWTIFGTVNVNSAATCQTSCNMSTQL